MTNNANVPFQSYFYNRNSSSVLHFQSALYNQEQHSINIILISNISTEHFLYLLFRFPRFLFFLLFSLFISYTNIFFYTELFYKILKQFFVVSLLFYRTISFVSVLFEIMRKEKKTITIV